MLRWRLLLGTLIIAALVGLCWLDGHATVPGIWLLPVVIVAAVLATKEMLDLLAAAGMKPARWLVYLANFVIVAITWIVQLWKIPGFRLYSDSLGSRCLNADRVRIVSPASRVCDLLCRDAPVSPAGQEHGQRRGWRSGDRLRWNHAPSSPCCFRLSWGVGALATWIVVVKMGDTGAYAVGRLIGRHKLAPLISPGKTIEGAVGGLLFACFGSWAAFRWLIPLCSPGQPA